MSIEQSLSRRDVQLKLSMLAAKVSVLAAMDSENAAVIPAGEMEREAEGCDHYPQIIMEATLSAKTLSSRALLVCRGPRPATCKLSEAPKLHVEPLRGEFSAWQSFWCQFPSAVHENATLPVIAKSQYLHSLVKGGACYRRTRLHC